MQFVNDDIERDLNLANLKNRFLQHEIDENELNRRASYLMHDHSVKRKFKISNINYSESQSIKGDDNTQSSAGSIDEEFLKSIEDPGIAKCYEPPPFRPFDPPTATRQPTQQKGIKDTQCNICKAYFTKRGLTKHVNSQHGKSN